MAQRIEFRLDSSDYSELGSKALSRGEVEKAIGYFKTACGIADDSASYTALGCAYAEIHALELSNAVLYTAMTKAKTEDDETPALWQLCSNALEEGDAEAAAYYLRYLGEDDSAVLAAADGRETPRVRMAKKPAVEFYETQLYYANEALADNDLDGALRCVREMGDAPEPYKSTAQKIEALCLFAKGDFDRVVALAEEMVKKDPSPDNKATLATAYSVQEGRGDGRLLDEIMAAEKLPVELALKVFPSLSRGAGRRRAAGGGTVSGSTRFKQFSEMYRAEALWNRANTARHPAMGAEQHLRRFSRGYYSSSSGGAERVPYGHEWPHGATLEFVNKVKKCARRGRGKIRSALAYDADFNEALRWVLSCARFRGVSHPLCLSCVATAGGKDIPREAHRVDLTFDAMEIILDYLSAAASAWSSTSSRRTGSSPSISFCRARSTHCRSTCAGRCTDPHATSSTRTRIRALISNALQRSSTK